MGQSDDQPNRAISAAELTLIDQVCDRYEAAWQAGEEPDAEDFLGDATGPRRSALLRELDAIETERRAKKGNRSTLRQFVRALSATGLMSADEVTAFQESLPADQQPNDAGQLARQLVRANKMTKFQVHAIYQRRTKGLVVGNYVILDRIGAGGMGQVYKARHQRMKRVVALKVLPSSFSRMPEAVQRFQREVEAAARLSHPNIVIAHDADKADGTHFLVMEYVDGSDLADVVKQRGPLPIDEAVDYTLQTARGLQYAHERSVIHRDIKPANLLLDSRGTVKILDMGLARIDTSLDSSRDDSDRITDSGQMMGTCGYVAPEQAEDSHTADHRADIYSLGCTLYRLLTAESPYKGDSVMQVLMAHRVKPIPSVRKARPEVPEELDAIIQKMMAKTPEDRYSSMNEVIEAIETCMSLKPPSETTASEPPQDEALTSFLQTLSDSQTGTPLSTEAATPTIRLPGTSPGSTPPSFCPGISRRKRIAIAGAAIFAFVAVGAVGAVLLTGRNRGNHTSGKRTPAPLADTRSATDRPSLPDVVGWPSVEPAATKPNNPSLKTGDSNSAPPEPWTTILPPDAPPAAESALRGIIPRPAKLPGIGRWNVETAAPRHFVWGVACSPDGSLIACGSIIGTIWIYDAKSLKPIRLLISDRQCVQDVAWSPDGEWIASASSGKTVRLWHRDGRPGPVLEGHIDGLRSLAWSPDSSRLVSASRDSTLRIWQIDGTPGPVLKGHKSIVVSVAWSPDGTTLASGGEDGEIRLWRSDGTPGRALGGHAKGVNSLAWSPDGNWLASGGDDNIVRLWKPDGTPGSVLHESSESVKSVAWSPDSRRLVVGVSNSFFLRAVDGTLIAKHAARNGVRDVVWSPDGQTIVFGCHPTGLAVYGTDGTPRLKSFGNFEVFSVAWKPDGRQIAVGCTDGSMRLLRSDGAQDRVLLPARVNQAFAMAWSPKGDRLVSGLTREICLRDADGALLEVRPGGEMNETAVAWSPDGRRIVSANEDHTLRLWDAQTLVAKVLEGHTASVKAVAWSPDSKQFASGSDDGALRLWNVDGTPGPVTEGHPGAVYAIAWRPDGLRIASGSQFRTIHFWKPDGSRDGRAKRVSGYHRALGWSPDGQWLASGDIHSFVRLWKPDGTAGPVFAGHDGAVMSVSWHPQGRRLVSSDQGMKIISRDTQTGELEWTTILLGDNRAVTFGPEGEILDGDPETIEKELVYLIEKPNGVIEVLKPSEFQQRVAHAAAKATRKPPPPAIAPFDATTAKKHQEAWADYLGEPVEQEIDLGDGVKLKMVLIPPGEFLMGSTEEEQARFLEEVKTYVGPNNLSLLIESIPKERQHRVRITRPFRLSRHEVTLGQFRQFVKETSYKTDAEQDGRGGHGMVAGNLVQEDPRFVWNTGPGFEQTDEHPVVNVSWNDATAFCEWLSAAKKGTGIISPEGPKGASQKVSPSTFSLPTEAQWEYACRAGTTTAWHCGNSDTTLEEYAWFNANAAGTTHPVGQLEPNGWSLYDMHGNVSEWCADNWLSDYYAQSPLNDPCNPPIGSTRVVRGGVWIAPSWYCRSAHRQGRSFKPRHDVGFRVAFVVESGKLKAETAAAKSAGQATPGLLKTLGGR